MAATIRTTCPYCGVGCGLRVRPGKGGGTAIGGDPDHPANRGKLCSKGAALAETLGSDERLLHPLWRGERVSWERALNIAAEGIRRTIARHGPDAIAFYVSGQLLTEDYYVANKLIKGFLGTANIDTNSRLCMASSVAGHRRAFGADVVPANYDDLDLADLVVLVGSNAAWCHPVLLERILAAKRARAAMRIVVVDPRQTPTAEQADLHLPLRSGSDGMLFTGLLAHLARHAHIDRDFIARHVRGAEHAIAAAVAAVPSIEPVATACGLTPAAVERFFAWFAETDRVVTLYSQGVNQSTSGTDKVAAILNCHLATGRIGKLGAGPLSLTGQPNAMGGREVGALANQLAAHMDIADPDDRARVRRFWQAPTLTEREGLKAVAMFEALAEGRIKAIWIMATNPAVSMPAAARVRRALRKCPLVIVSDCVRSADTADFAHLLLPALSWGEKDGTVTNSERRISRQRRFLPEPGEARADWWIITQVARRLGFADAFPYEKPVEIFREHARLSGFENDGARAFDISALADISADDYDALSPHQWPMPQERPRGTKRLFGDGRFFTSDGRGRMIAITPRMPRHAPSPALPFVLNTGRLRDHWHTMTRTGQSPSLSAHESEPMVAIHPRDAERAGLVDGALAQLVTAHGRAILRVRCTGEQMSGAIFAPMHWSASYASHGGIGALVNADTDPISGQPELKHTPAKIVAYRPTWQAFLATTAPIAPVALRGLVWSRAKTRRGWRYELAGDRVPENWPRWAEEIFPASDGGDWLSYEDPAIGAFRYALVVDRRLLACLFVARDRPSIDRDWLADLLGQEPPLSQPLHLLAGRPPGGSHGGRLICACFGVGEDTIVAAIRRERLDNVDGVGLAAKAGTNCGSCRPELARLIRRATAPAASA